MTLDSFNATRGLRLIGAFLLVGALAMACSSAVGSDQDKSQVKLTASAGAIAADGQQTITIKMQINKGWHAYANPVKNEPFEVNKTEVNITSAKKLEKVDVAYPAGRKYVDGMDEFQVYEGDVEIKATVKRAAGDTGPLEVTVNFSTCNDKTCLPPETVKLQVK
ncbi:MAG TPA: protein-disulfide reductase DsbD N-terminal domain-containing protein [Gemmataceae bacterium]|nr:protein-disulfide reductase DsbD N-terminal domain-containing protein [Gemmataceae bacterium]